ncbi:MAG: GspE/PulE family protein [Candidatus Spechtbacterales bacterium]
MDVQDPQNQLEKIRRQQEENLAKQRAESHGMPYLNLSAVPLHPESISTLDEQTAKEAHVTVIQKKEASVSVGVENPNNPKTQEVLGKLKKAAKEINVFLVSHSSLEAAWSHYSAKKIDKEEITGAVKLSEAVVESFRKKISSIADIGKLLGEVSKKNASGAFEALLGATLALDGTDIHIEPLKEGAVVRVKIDGILYESANLDQHIYNLILSRVKLLSKLKLNIKNQPQEGRFSAVFEDRQVEIRTSILPAEYNEDIALRLLDPKFLLSMKELGLRKDLEETLIKSLKKPQGLILVTGATGSGKTTTLYACIKYLKTPGVKIITIEDPIEYHLAGITQTQVREKEGYIFETGLKAILRQDPDIILISELRSVDAAEAAIQAALAGRQVLSTLHTIDAAGTAPRLADMGIDSSAVSSALSMSIAQRLIRKLCENCKVKKRLNDMEYKAIKNAFTGISENVQVPEIKKDSYIWESKKNGCSECFNTGYKGRTGIFEIMEITREIEEKILVRPAEDELRDFARKNGMTSLKQDGLLKVLSGITSIEEIERNLGTIGEI